MCHFEDIISYAIIATDAEQVHRGILPLRAWSSPFSDVHAKLASTERSPKKPGRLLVKGSELCGQDCLSGAQPQR